MGRVTKDIENVELIAKTPRQRNF